MKTLILSLWCSLSIANAQLIDLTPGGFNPHEGLPPVFFELQEQTFLDEAAHGWFNLPWGDEYINGWVSLFGALNGGEYFRTNLFRLGDTPSASIWWDFGRTEYGITMLDVWGRRADGTPRENIYRVTRNSIHHSPPVIVTVDGMTTIQSISFYGTDHGGRRVPARLLRDFAR